MNKRPPNSKIYAIGLGPFRAIVEHCLRKLDKDPYYCELCRKWFTQKLTIHHKKYAGATIHDLCYACQKCQCQPINKNLD